MSENRSILPRNLIELRKEALDALLVSTPQTHERFFLNFHLTNKARLRFVQDLINQDGYIRPVA